jgi:hypothetical protein
MRFMILSPFKLVSGFIIEPFQKQVKKKADSKLSAFRLAKKVDFKGPLVKGGWHGEAVTGGFAAPGCEFAGNGCEYGHFPANPSDLACARPPPFRQGRLFAQLTDVGHLAFCI